MPIQAAQTIERNQRFASEEEARDAILLYGKYHGVAFQEDFKPGQWTRAKIKVQCQHVEIEAIESEGGGLCVPGPTPGAKSTINI